jgi:hypothetical protein
MFDCESVWLGPDDASANQAKKQKNLDKAIQKLWLSTQLARKE